MRGFRPFCVINLAVVLVACGGSNDRDAVAVAPNGSAQAASVCQSRPSTPEDMASRPHTIPALQEWASGERNFEFDDATRIVLDTGSSPALQQIAETFAADIEALTGHPILVISGSSRAGDIVLGTADRCDARLGNEGYGMQVGEALHIRAPQGAGVFYGTRSVLQLLAHDNSIPAGHALDWPRYPERAFYIDNGRKFFTPQWLEQHVREIAYLKFNQLHLHFTENLGWRIESERHPEVVSPEHLSQQQVRELIALAARYHITVIPEIDMPGHMGAALAAHPEWQLKDVLGRANPNNLDYTLPAARQFLFELIDEYLELFPGPYWHMGADEYLITIPAVPTPLDYTLYPQLETYARGRYGASATAKDGILGLANEINDFVRARGKILRVYNDGVSGGNAVTLNPNIDVEWWTDRDGPAPQALLDAGHRITNMGWFPTYYVNGFPGNFIPGYPSEQLPILPPRPDMASTYESWSVHRFYGPIFLNANISLPPQVIAPEEPRNLGSKLLVWNDGPDAATEAQIATGIFPNLRVIAQKTWESPSLTPRYADFLPIMQAVGHAPGYGIP